MPDGTDTATIAAMTSILSSPARGNERRHGRSSSLSWLGGAREPLHLRLRLTGMVLTGLLGLATGLAYAGQLPAPVQNAVSVVLATAGLPEPQTEEREIPTGEDADADGSQTEDQATPVGPDVTGPAKGGLCNAYFSGQGGDRGGKDDSTAFGNLEEAAGKLGVTVEAFCEAETPQGEDTDDAEGENSIHRGPGHAVDRDKGPSAGLGSHHGNGNGSSHHGGNGKGSSGEPGLPKD